MGIPEREMGMLCRAGVGSARGTGGEVSVARRLGGREAGGRGGVASAGEDLVNKREPQIWPPGMLRPVSEPLFSFHVVS